MFSTLREVGRVVLLLVATASPALAQEPGLLEIVIQMPDTDEVSRNNTTGHRAYVELENLSFTITAINESNEPVVIDQTTLREAFSVRLGAEFDIAATVRWLTTSNRSDTPVVGLGNEAGAIQVLLNGGLPQESIGDTVATMRQRVMDRTVENRR